MILEGAKVSFNKYIKSSKEYVGFTTSFFGSIESVTNSDDIEAGMINCKIKLDNIQSNAHTDE